MVPKCDAIFAFTPIDYDTDIAPSAGMKMEWEAAITFNTPRFMTRESCWDLSEDMKNFIKEWKSDLH
jgi:hypothetical protein